uniref:Uncharacterized protein n=1 Tax=Acrobeloides nanus TaxID=290746 RepID=A0A914DVQ3_9BILA
MVRVCRLVKIWRKGVEKFQRFTFPAATPGLVFVSMAMLDVISVDHVLKKSIVKFQRFTFPAATPGLVFVSMAMLDVISVDHVLKKGIVINF